MALIPAFLPGESPWTEGPGGLHVCGSLRVGHNCAGDFHNLPYCWLWFLFDYNHYFGIEKVANGLF